MALLGVDQRTVIEDIEFESEEGAPTAATLVVARVRPRSGVSRPLRPLRPQGALV